MSDDTPAFISLIGGVIGLWFLLWLLVFVTHTVSIFASDPRCTARGYETTEIVVHYPNFWSVDTYCYGEGRQDGVKL